MRMSSCSCSLRGLNPKPLEVVAETNVRMES